MSNSTTAVLGCDGDMHRSAIALQPSHLQAKIVACVLAIGAAACGSGESSVDADAGDAARENEPSRTVGIRCTQVLTAYCKRAITECMAAEVTIDACASAAHSGCCESSEECGDCCSDPSSSTDMQVQRCVEAIERL